MDRLITDHDVVEWLLQGDVSIQYQVHRDLLGSEHQSLWQRIEKEGWGARFLSCRAENGHWGRGFYQPKWTSTHYSLLDLKNLAIWPDNREIGQTLNLVLKNNRGADGGIVHRTHAERSDVCLNGMFLNYACYFRVAEKGLESIVDFLISQQMKDGGFNCHSNSCGAVHSSLHTSLSVAEGILEYTKNGYRYRIDKLLEAERGCREFMLQHRLLRSDRTGEIIDKKMLMLSFPSRWRYDILRALDYFRMAAVDHDIRMDDAVRILLKKRRNDGTWPLQARHPGRSHFEMEKPGSPSRWNTLRALRVLKHFQIGEN